MIETVSSALRNVDINPIIEEFIPLEKREPIPYERIRKDVQSSDAVFLFLTDKVMMTEHTKNWIIFEDGLAAASDKQLFLFERKGVPLRYPVPYLTDYMIFDKKSTGDLLKIQETSKRLRSYFSLEEKRTVPPEFNEGFGGVLWALYAFFKIKKKAKLLKRLEVPKVECQKCRVQFYYHSSEHRSFECPVCRGTTISL